MNFHPIYFVKHIQALGTYMNRPSSILRLFFILSFSAPFMAVAQEKPAAVAHVDFVNQVQPILEQNCLSCHYEKKDKGKVRLDTKEFAFEDEEVLSPGNPDDSSLYWTTTLDIDEDEIMPPQDKKERDPYPLSIVDQEILKNWILQGAEWPDGVVLAPKRRLPSKLDFKKDIQPVLEQLTDQRDLSIITRWMQEGGTFPKGATLDFSIKGPKPFDGMSAEKLYTTLGLKPGPVQEANTMEAYAQNIPPLDVEFDMLPIAGGEFMMGSPEDEPGRKADERTPIKVKVDPFWMAKHELTWELYELWQASVEIDERNYLKAGTNEVDLISDAVSRPTPAYMEMSFGMGKTGYPAICMTHLSARMYCMWLSAKTGHFYRLPTAAEWEYACRAGTTTAYHFGDDKSELKNYAWTYDNSDWQYQKVGKKKPNQWGLHDMHGNVWEWVLDDYVIPKATQEILENPLRVPKEMYGRTVRGGGWDDKADKQRSAARMESNEAWKARDPQIPQSVWWLTDAKMVGMRIVRPLAIPDAKDIGKFWPSQAEMETIPKR